MSQGGSDASLRRVRRGVRRRSDDAAATRGSVSSLKRPRPVQSSTVRSAADDGSTGSHAHRVPSLCRVPRRTRGRLCAVIAIAVIAAACARQWPAEPPDVHQWQVTTGPLNLVPRQQSGRSITAFAYAWQRPNPPSCDGVGLDDCTAYVGQYGRHLPARLSVTCWDQDDDGQGAVDITFIPSRPILDYPQWHPRVWSGWGLDFDGDGGPKNVFAPAAEDGRLGLVDGFIPFVPGDELVGRTLRFFSETAGSEDAQLSVIATFPERDGSAPLEWRFDIGPGSLAHERVRHVVENCGRVW